MLASIASRERIRFRFSRTVLISPLWATNRNGCANGHDGNVFVEKRLVNHGDRTRHPTVSQIAEEEGELHRREHPLERIVLLDSDGKYTPIPARSTLRAYARSRLRDVGRGGPVRVTQRTAVLLRAETNRYVMCGMKDSAVLPMSAPIGSTSTSCQPRISMPSVPLSRQHAPVRQPDCGSVAGKQMPAAKGGRRRGAIRQRERDTFAEELDG